MKHIKLYEEFVNEGKSGADIKPGEYIKSEYGYFYQRVEGMVGGQPAFVYVDPDKKGGLKIGKKKTGIANFVKYEKVTLEDIKRALNIVEGLGFEQFINEADVTQPIDGTEVVVMPGRFQPFHNGHIAALKNAAKIFGKPVVAMQIVSKNEDSPFPESLLLQIGQEVAKNEKEIADFFIYPNTYGRTVIPWFVRFLREQGYETVGVGAGSDRIKAYTPQIKYVTSDKTDTVVHPDFKLEMVDARVEGGPSGTKTREALANDDREAFEKMVPKYLYKYYDKLRKYV